MLAQNHRAKINLSQKLSKMSLFRILSFVTHANCVMFLVHDDDACDDNLMMMLCFLTEYATVNYDVKLNVLS